VSGVPSVRRLRFRYEKTGPSRFVSHRNFCKLVERALRRTGFPLVFSAGFTPRPRLSFGPPLPVGVGGCREAFDAWTDGNPDVPGLLARTDLLPEGARLLSAAWAAMAAPALSAAPLVARYSIEKQGIADRSALALVGTPAGEDERHVFLDIALTGFSHKALLAAAGGAAIERTILRGDDNGL